MNQASTIGFGSDATLVAGYAQRGNERLGNFDLIIENTGVNALTLFVREHDGVTSPSGYKNLLGPISIVPKGNDTVSLKLLAKKIAFFGSGNTTANISVALRNPANLRGAQIDVVAVERRNFGFDDGANKKAMRSPGWPTLPNA